VPRKDLIGPVFATYWPPGRITLRTMLPATPFLGLLLAWPRRGRRRVPDRSTRLNRNPR
jgi:hypothetical protein